ncbi:hypothetical protein F8388_016634 [Cannabis sativa]|uniref:DUF4283 domain-containing protein n=1 Tax=Cannabis sativa TaxID=3483 RepID=A0A7J6FAS7_CANSA|nr:hypothetical protein F8388_016634 [Cannabis sativa]
MEQYESEAIIKRQSEIRNDFSDWLSIANRTAQDVSSVKKVSPSILRSNIVRNLENSFEKSNKDVEEILGSKKRIDIEFKDIAEEGFVRRLWKDEVVKVGLLTKGIFIIRFQNMEQRDKVMHQGYVFFDIKPMFMKPWNPIDDFTKEEGETSQFKIVSHMGEPLQVDNVTKNRDRLQCPRILIQINTEKENQVDADGFQKVSEGKKILINNGKEETIDQAGFSEIHKTKITTRAKLAELQAKLSQEPHNKELMEQD